MSKCISSYGEFSEHDSTDGVCNWCGETELDYDDLRQALETIQELHKPLPYHGYDGKWLICDYCDENHPCPTRKLADAGLAGEERD